MKMKKKFKENKKTWTLAALLATTVFASSTLVAIGAVQTNANISSSSAKKQAGDSSSSSTPSSDSSTYAKVRSAANFSKKIPADMTFVNSPKPTVEKTVSFVNGEGRNMIEFSTDSTGNVIVNIPQEVKIYTTKETKNINNNSFDICIKTYNPSAYSFSENGFNENSLVSEEHVPFKIIPNTISDPLGISGPSSSYVVFEPTGPKGKIVGNVNSGYVQVSVNIENDSTYYGPNSLHVAQGHEYSAFLENRNGFDPLKSSFIFSNMSGEPSVMYDNISASQVDFIPNLDWLTAADNITASEFLASDKISSIPIKAQYHIAHRHQHYPYYAF